MCKSFKLNYAFIVIKNVKKQIMMQIYVVIELVRHFEDK